VSLVSYLLRRSPTGRARSSAYVEYRSVFHSYLQKNLASNDLPLLKRYVETENGIEEEAACFSGIYITAIVRRFHSGPL